MLLTAIKNIWITADYICSKRLKEAIPLWLPYYESTYGIISEGIKHKLKTISAATIDRLLRAVWNKGSEGVLAQIQNIENAIPFDLLGFDCDNGSEFLNHHLLRYFINNGKNTKFTRSRPYKKNDNAHVEQKNWTQVRLLFGYDRLDINAHIDPMNEL